MSCHSRFNNKEYPLLCGIPILPLHPEVSDGSDIIDEAIEFFRFIVFFKNYNLIGRADKLIVYLTLFIQKVLLVLRKYAEMKDREKSFKVLREEKLLGPGESGFVLDCYTEKGNAGEGEKLKEYLRSLRNECMLRLIKK